MASEKDRVDEQTLRFLLGRARAVATNSPFNFDGLLASPIAILEDLTLDLAATLEITVALRDARIAALRRSMFLKESALVERTMVVDSFKTLQKAVSLEEYEEA